MAKAKAPVVEAAPRAVLVKTPNPQYNGDSMGIHFSNGCALVDPDTAERMKTFFRGYTYEEVDPLSVIQKLGADFHGNLPPEESEAASVADRLAAAHPADSAGRGPEPEKEESDGEAEE